MFNNLRRVNVCTSKKENYEHKVHNYLVYGLSSDIIDIDCICILYLCTPTVQCTMYIVHGKMNRKRYDS